MITFKENTHTYTDQDQKYTSVTTLISRFKQPFDSKKISEAYAKKNPEKTAKEWRDEWERIKDEACEKGTDFHNEQEQKIIEAQWVTIGNNTILPVIAPKKSEGKSEGRDLSELIDGVYPELILYDKEFNIAGQSDIVNIETVHGTRFIDIDDYKTNKEIKETSFFNYKTQQYKMMKKPLDSLMDCNYVHYCLQTSIYAYLLERQGYTVRNVQFRHCTKTNKGNDLHKVYTVDYSKYKKHVKKILKLNLKIK